MSAMTSGRNPRRSLSASVVGFIVIVATVATVATPASAGALIPSRVYVAADPYTILIGETSTLSGGIIDGPAGGEVTFYVLDGATATPISTQTVNGSGQAWFDVSPVVTTSYEIRFAGDATWEPSSFQTTLEVNKHPTSINLRTGHGEVAYPKAFTLTAALEGGADDRELAFYSILDGSQHLLGTETPDDEGRARITVHAKRNASYVARYAGDDLWAESQSQKVRVDIRVQASGRMVRALSMDHGTAVYRCCTARYVFHVAPNQGGTSTSYLLEVRRPSGGWQTVGTKKFPLGDNSSLLVSVRIRGAAGYTFRLTGCMRDQPDNRGDCAKPSPFRFVSGRSTADAFGEGWTVWSSSL